MMELIGDGARKKEKHAEWEGAEEASTDDELLEDEFLSLLPMVGA